MVVVLISVVCDVLDFVGDIVVDYLIVYVFDSDGLCYVLVLCCEG